MNLSDHLQIFHETYMRRQQEFDLPENEIIELLEGRYPQPLSDARKSPLLKDRIKNYMSELSCEDHPEDEAFSAKDIYLLYSQTFLSISCLASTIYDFSHCLPFSMPTLEQNIVSPMILIRYAVWLDALSICG